MSPAFASSLRKLQDLRKELGHLTAANAHLDVMRSALVPDEHKSWVVNAALSSGVSGLYTGMEDILRGVLIIVDGFVPSGESSHQNLIDQAYLPREPSRPAIITPAVFDGLVELRRFRHFERHAYRYRFDTGRVEENQARAEAIVPLFIRDVETFIAAMSSPPDA